MRNHHIIFEILLPGHGDEQFEERFYCSGPITALNEFHRLMQNHRAMASDRKTLVRPKLAPREYRIVRLFEKYLDVEGNPVESNFDIPNTPNPDVVEDAAAKRAAKKADKDPANFFGFYAEAEGERPPDTTLPAQA